MRFRRGPKLNRRLAAEVRFLAKEEKTLQRIIAWAYGISRPHTSNIKHERRWPHAGSQPPANKKRVRKLERGVERNGKHHD